ncbi:ABC transporter permease [Demequina subtropica]|uniref:ABC transporter permease n=1 Tax=Demequina subtropica TaxID=1638989 RepID=UPI000782455D|nr:hypothetical protein [Demequina subtropica]
MTVLDDTPAAAPAPGPAPASSRRPVKGNPWLPTLRGTLLVTQIELMRRRPTAKGWIFYGLLFAGIMAIGLFAAAQSDGSKNSTLLELVLVMVLGAGLLVAPSLSATSLNGDSSEGVLAPLQMTRLTAGDLAVGKLLASWLFALAVLLTTTPLLVYAFSRSGWHWDELLIVMAVILLVVLTATAVGLAWSALAARAVASVSLAHLTTGFLLLGTLLLFFFTQPLISVTVTETSRSFDWDQFTPEQEAAVDAWYMNGDPSAFDGIDVHDITCSVQDGGWEHGVARTEQTAWLLLVNPVVLIGESSPIVNYLTWDEDGRAAPGLFAEMHRAVSDARIGPSEEDLQDSVNWDECVDLVASVTGDYSVYEDNDWEQEQEANSVYPRAPWLGLGVQAALLLGSMWIVIARLRVPYKKLRQGTRVA